MAFQPHFLALAAALVTAASDRRLVSAVDVFPVEEEVEFSRFKSCAKAPKEPRDFADGASDLNEELLTLVGLEG